MASNSQKLSISLYSGALAGALNLPSVYKLTNKVLPFNTINENSCPTNEGFLTHMVVFFVVTYLTMGGSNMSNNEKLKNTVYSTLIYYFAFSNKLVSVVQDVLGLELITNGCVNYLGLAVQLIIYVGCLYGVMFFD